MLRSAIPLAAATLILTGCGEERRPGDLTAEEQEQLNEAAAMLDEANSLIDDIDESLANAAVAVPRDPPANNSTGQ